MDQLEMDIQEVAELHFMLKAEMEAEQDHMVILEVSDPAEAQDVIHMDLQRLHQH